MDGSLESILNLYITTSGRLLFGIRQVRAAADEQDFVELVKHCDATIAHALATRQLERRWAGEPVETKANPAAQRIDVLVDRLLGAIRDHAVAQAQGAAPGDPIHATMESFVKQVFPVSVHAVTSLPFVEELAAVDDIVKLFKGKLAPAVKELGLGRLAQRLAALADQYREALEAPPESFVQWGRVRAARAEGQGMLLEAVAIILGRHHDRTPEGTAKRLALLSPILAQNEAIAQYLKARRSVSDVDPETGEDAPGTAEGGNAEGGKVEGGKPEGGKPEGGKPEGGKLEGGKPENG